MDRIEGEWRIVGALKDGKKHGQWLRIDSEGRLWQLETWRNGYRHGLDRSWHENGRLFSDGMYRYGHAHGRNRIFDDDGQLGVLGWDHKGRPIGIWCEWAPDGSGRLAELTEYFDGRKVREQAAPEGPCPLTQGPGRRHFDPEDMSYE